MFRWAAKKRGASFLDEFDVQRNFVGVYGAVCSMTPVQSGVVGDALNGLRTRRHRRSARTRLWGLVRVPYVSGLADSSVLGIYRGDRWCESVASTPVCGEDMAAPALSYDKTTKAV